MSAETTAAAAGRVPRASLFGIGRYYLPDGSVDVPVSWDDMGRDTAWAAEMLRSHGMGESSVVLVVSNGNEMLWKAAFEEAILSLMATWCAADQWSFDAGRTAAFVNRLHPDMVLNLGPDVTQELAARPGGLAWQLGSTSAVLAHPASLAPLRDAGVTAFLFARLGPAVAVECPQGGAHVNGDEWSVAVLDGELRVTTRGARAHVVENAATGVAGGLEDGTCPCGRTGQRVVLA